MTARSTSCLLAALLSFVLTNAIHSPVASEDRSDAKLLHDISCLEISLGKPCSWSWSFELSESDEAVRRLLTWPLGALQSTDAKAFQALLEPSPVFVCDCHNLRQPALLAQRILRARRSQQRPTVLVLELFSEDLQADLDAAIPYRDNLTKVRGLLEAIDTTFSLEAYPSLVFEADRVLAGVPAVPPTGLAQWKTYWTDIANLIDQRLRNHAELVLFYGARHILEPDQTRGFAYPAGAQIVVTGLATWEIAIRRRLPTLSPAPLRLSERILFFPVSDASSLGQANREWAKRQNGKLEEDDVNLLSSANPDSLLVGLQRLRKCAPWERARYLQVLGRLITHFDSKVRDAAFRAIEGWQGRYDVPARFAGPLIESIRVANTGNFRRCTDLLARIDLFDGRHVAALREMSKEAYGRGRFRDVLAISIALASSLHCTSQDVPQYRQCLLQFHADKEVRLLVVRLGNCGPLAKELLDDLKRLFTSNAPAVRQAARRAVARIEADLLLLGTQTK